MRSTFTLSLSYSVHICFFLKLICTQRVIVWWKIKFIFNSSSFGFRFKCLYLSTPELIVVQLLLLNEHCSIWLYKRVKWIQKYWYYLYQNIDPLVFWILLGTACVVNRVDDAVVGIAVDGSVYKNIQLFRDVLELKTKSLLKPGKAVRKS